MELVDGKVVIMSPSGFESDEVAFRFGSKLFQYVDAHKLGRMALAAADLRYDSFHKVIHAMNSVNINFCGKATAFQKLLC